MVPHRSFRIYKGTHNRDIEIKEKIVTPIGIYRLSLGVQEIYDKYLKLETSFVTKLGGNHGGDWTARVKVDPRVNIHCYIN